VENVFVSFFKVVVHKDDVCW